MAMPASSDPRTPVPGRGTLKTFGALNVAFGGLLIVFSSCVGLYIVGLPLILPAFQRQIDRSQAAEKAQRETRIAELKRLEATETDPEAKEKLRDERIDLETTVDPPVNVDTVGLSEMGFSKPVVLGHYATDIATAILLDLAMIVAGVGLLKAREWGRSLAVGVAAVKLARLALLTVSLLVFVGPSTARSMSEWLARSNVESGIATTPAATEATRKQLLMINVVYAVGFALVGGIYPAFVVHELRRPAVRAAVVRRSNAG